LAAKASESFLFGASEGNPPDFHLHKTKDVLLGKDRKLRLDSDKVRGVTIEKLTRDNSTISAKFAEPKEVDTTEVQYFGI
jgi:hypothetical protein